MRAVLPFIVLLNAIGLCAEELEPRTTLAGKIVEIRKEVWSAHFDGRRVSYDAAICLIDSPSDIAGFAMNVTFDSRDVVDHTFSVGNRVRFSISASDVRRVHSIIEGRAIDGIVYANDFPIYMIRDAVVMEGDAGSSGGQN